MSQLLINLSFAIPEPTGLATYAIELLPHLRPLDPLLLAPQPIADFRHQVVPANMTSDLGAKGHLRRLLWTQFRLPVLYRRSRSHLLFSPVPEAPIRLLRSNLRSGLRSGLQSVVMVHDLIPLRLFPPRSRLHLYSKYYVRWVAEQAAHLLCNSQATANDLVDFFQIPARKITITPLAHNPDRYRFLDLPRQDYFLYIGRNDPYKNLSGAIAAFQQFLNLAPAGPWELWVAGPMNDRYQPDLVAQIAEAGLTDRVRFLGYVPIEQLPVLLNQAIALVFPTRWEGFGIPALEAMACGTPVITSNLASLPEVTGDAAWLTNPDCPAAIAAAMHQLAIDATLWQEFRQRSLVRSTHFSWAKTAAPTIEVLQRYL
ncbi:MAG: glycosyltransferase family 1 protein [Oscillatoriales cyanobacterium]|nr:MAG: glycosyltransferase family 1 protein [Oscillatoriales cyanobacterium]